MCCAVLSCSVVSDSATPWTVAHQAPLPVGILQARILEWVAMPSSGIYVYLQLIHILVQQKHNIVKQLSSIKKHDIY